MPQGSALNQQPFSVDQLAYFYINNFFIGILDFFPKLILFLIFIIFGYLVGWIVSFLISSFVNKLNLNKYLADIGLAKFLEKANIELRADRFLGKLFFFIVFLVFLLPAFDILGLSVFSQLLNEVLKFLPKAIVSGVIFVFALVVADFLRKTIYAFLKGLEIRGAHTGSNIFYYSVIVFGLILALNNLGIATEVFNILLMGIVLAIALAFGLSFGLGGQDIARQFLENFKEKLD
jgi:hypothetical protein